MDANIENFQKYIVRKIVMSVEYDVDNDEYLFNRCQLSDTLINEIIHEGQRYGMSEKDIRQYISTTAQHIKTQPKINTIANDIDIKTISFGQHILIEFRHPEKGNHWISCIKLRDDFLVLSSSICRLEFGTRICPTTKYWTYGFYADFTFRNRNESSAIKDVLLRIGEITAIKILSPSVTHELLDSPQSFSKNETPILEKERKKNLSLRQKENDFWSIIDLIYKALKGSSIQKDYDTLKSQIIDIGLSSYTLNEIIKAAKNDYEKTIAYYNLTLFDQTFFIYNNGNAKQELDKIKEKLENAKKEHNAVIKKMNQKEGCFISTIVFLFFVTMGIALFFQFKNDELEKENSKIIDEKKQVIRENTKLENRIKTLSKYTFTTGATIKENSGCDNSWILWLNAKEKVCIESFYIRGSSTGKVVIKVFNENDILIKTIESHLQNTQFKEIHTNITLDKGRYYMKIANGINLQYHSSSNNEYERFLGGYLEVTGSCGYRNRKDKNAFKEHSYYQYFYNIKYHLVSE